MKFLYKGSSLLLDDVIENTAKTLSAYVTTMQSVVDSKNYEAAESTINLPSDEELLKKVKELKNQKVSPKLKYIVDIGIGGSNLGTKAIYDAFYGYYDILEPNRSTPKMIFVDTNEENFLAKLVAFIETLSDKEEVLVNAISKSGGTTETIANTEIVMAALEKKFPGAKDRLVITTDEGSALWNEAEKQGIAKLGLPKQVGGRYSVLSAVGLFPLAALGLDIDALRAGAVDARTKALTTDVMQNEAVISATILYLHYRNGKNINDNFFFAPQLESIGKWYRQLMGESCGKDGKGITPTVSLGSTDLHSVGQLYLDGPKDKTFTFVSTEKPKYEASVPEKLQFPLVEHLEGKRASMSPRLRL
jgi:glucose-6-phosphate isomerase